MSETTSYDIKAALAKRHAGREFFITECKSGPTGTGMLQFDGLAINKSWVHPCITGYEVKVSRSDFLRDNKYCGYMPFCHELYFVVPAGMIDRLELQNDIGLIYYNPATKSLITKKKALHRNIEINAYMLLYIFMNRIDGERAPFTSSSADYWKDWLANKIDNHSLKYRVKSKLLEQIYELENESKNLSKYKELREEHNEIIKIMNKHGISTWHHAPEALEKALSRAYPPEIDIIHEQLQNAITEIDKLKSKSEDKHETEVDKHV